MQAQTRYRCDACGNLTRFDVTETTQRTSYYHFTIGGELNIEDPEVINRTVDSVTCRWCGTGDSVVELAVESKDEVKEGPDVV